jgi:hypothetical protein
MGRQQGVLIRLSFSVARPTHFAGIQCHVHPRAIKRMLRILFTCQSASLLPRVVSILKPIDRMSSQETQYCTNLISMTFGRTHHLSRKSPPLDTSFDTRQPDPGPSEAGLGDELSEAMYCKLLVSYPGHGYSLDLP